MSLLHGECGHLVVHGELIHVPAQQSVASVRIDGALDRKRKKIQLLTHAPEITRTRTHMNNEWVRVDRCSAFEVSYTQTNTQHTHKLTRACANIPTGRARRRWPARAQRCDRPRERVIRLDVQLVVHTHARTHARTRTNAHIHTSRPCPKGAASQECVIRLIHTHTQTNTHAHSPTHMQTHTLTHSHCAHANIRTHTYQQAVRGGGGQLVLKRVAGQERVIRLNVQLIVLIERVVLQEANH